jgi:competence protein ComEC
VRVPAALIALPLCAASATGVILFEHAPERLILAAAAAAVLCTMAGLSFCAADDYQGVLLCVVVGTACAGYAMGAAVTRDLFAPPLVRWFSDYVQGENAPVLVEGVLREDAAVLPYGVVLTLDVRAVATASGRYQAPGGVRLVVDGTPDAAAILEWRAGRAVRASATLRWPMWFSNPGVPDARRALALRRIALTGSIKSGALVEVSAPGNPVSEAGASARAWTRAVIGRHVGRHDPRSAAVTSAILIGDRTGLSPDDERRLQEAGTYHVIAISGGNIAILTAVLIAVLRITRMPYRAGATVSIGLLLLYGEIAGGTASVGRAITAAVLFLVALILDHRGSPLNVVAGAAVLAVAVLPVTAVDAGFLLSFGATVGIMLGVPRLLGPVMERSSAWPRIVRVVVGGVTAMMAATVCAEIALAPVAATFFSRITFAGLVVNFAAIPLMTAVQCGAMTLLAAEAFGVPGTAALGWFVHVCAWSLVESSRFVELAPWLARDVPPPAVWLCAVYYASCLALLSVRRGRRVWAVALFVSTLLLVGDFGIGGRRVVPPRPPDTLRVVCLDVGQGDATLAIMPNGRALLIDTGGLAGTTFDVGARVVTPALRALGVRELHAIVLTHGDPDHIDGTEAVLRSLWVANIWEGVPVPPHAGLRAIAALANSRRIVWRTVRPGDVERIGEVEVRVHHPPDPDWERQRVRNDDSVVIELRTGQVSILLPGDISAEIERALVPRMSPAPLVILKAAHHGSATSSSDTFLDAITPRAVVFSAGRNNRFNHPAPLVVERFRRRGAETFSTAHDGAVFIDTDGRTATLHTWHSARRLELRPGGKDHPR